MKTNFIHARIQLPGGHTFILDGNSKITAGNGTFAEPAPNAFSLPAASVSAPSYCPGSTDVCRASCYVKGLAKHAPDLYRAYAGNAVALRIALADHAMGRAAHALAEWINVNARGGFRWHVSGDVWHEAHAAWIVRVARLSAYVPQWIYTRTLHAVSILVQADNLAVNVSADNENLVRAVSVARANSVRVCYMATANAPYFPGLRDDDVIFPDYALRGRDLADPTSAPWWRGLTHEARTMVCPADFFDQSESARCGPCRKCLDP